MSLCYLGIREWPCRQSYSRQNQEIFLFRSLLEGQLARSKCSLSVGWVNKDSPSPLLGLSWHHIGSSWSGRQGAEGAPICAQVKRCGLTCIGAPLRAKCCDAFLGISITLAGRPPSLGVSEHPLESIRPSGECPGSSPKLVPSWGSLEAGGTKASSFPL